MASILAVGYILATNWLPTVRLTASIHDGQQCRLADLAAKLNLMR